MSGPTFPPYPPYPPFPPFPPYPPHPRPAPPPSSSPPGAGQHPQPPAGNGGQDGGGGQPPSPAPPVHQPTPPPTHQPQPSPPPAPKPTPPPSGDGSEVSKDALKYVGNKYVWGGAPGTTAGKDDGTDCSGFVNMVVGRDLKRAIPGYEAGKYTGSVHGPVTEDWLAWSGATTISQSEVKAGDLACWKTHIGIFTDDGKHVVSSLDTKSGVVTTTVAGATPTGETLTCRRLKSP